MLLNYRIRPFTKYVTSVKYKSVVLFLNEAIEWTIYSKVFIIIIIRESVPLINKAWTILIAFTQVALLQLVKWFCFSTHCVVFLWIGSLKAVVYQLIYSRCCYTFGRNQGKELVPWAILWSVEPDSTQFAVDLYIYICKPFEKMGWSERSVQSDIVMELRPNLSAYLTFSTLMWLLHDIRHATGSCIRPHAKGTIFSIFLQT